MKKNKKLPAYFNKLYPILLIFATIFMGIGYAMLNSTKLEVSGSLVGLKQDGIFITQVKYQSDNNAEPSKSYIDYYVGTAVKSYLKLTNDQSSSITYEITVYNSDKIDYYFDKVLQMDMENNITYTNSNITYQLAGIQKDDVVRAGETRSFTVTFSYANKENITDTELTSILNYKFVKSTERITLNLDYNGTTGTTTQMIVYKDDVLIDLPSPQRSNYAFMGWYTNLTDGKLYDNGDIADFDTTTVTLYAKWSALPPSINNIPTITMTQNEAKNYYGQTVRVVNGTEYNPNSADQRTWKVFYIDTDNKYGDGKGTIYLKADENSSKTMVFSTTFDETNTSGYTAKFTTMSSTRYYKITDNNIVNSSGTIINTMYLNLNPTYATGRKAISSTILYEAEKAAAYLCDKTQFTSYADSRANYAIGSPTAEMWIDSWNQLYGANYKFNYRYNINVDGTTEGQKLPGYQFNLNGGTWDQAAGLDTININTIDTTGMFTATTGTWLATPAIVYGGASLVRISPLGFIGNATLNLRYAYTPVVSLNSNSIVYTNQYN